MMLLFIPIPVSCMEISTQPSDIGFASRLILPPFGVKTAGSVIEGVMVEYDVSRKQVSTFASKEIEKVRIFSAKGYIDINWPEQQRSVVMQAEWPLLETRTKYKICKTESEPVKDNANKDGY